MAYMRIESGKFWAWVIVSLLVGLGIGLGIMFWQSASTGAKVTKLERQLAAASEDASASVEALQGRTASAEASAADLAAKNAQLSSDLAAATARIAELEKAPSTESSTTIELVSRTVSPSTVTTGGKSVTLTVKVKGDATKVTFRIYTADKKYSQTYTLTKSSTSGDTVTWKRSVKAPVKAGTYKYYATAYDGTTGVTMKGASPSTLTVK